MRGFGPAGATDLQHSPIFTVDWLAWPVTCPVIRDMLNWLVIQAILLT
jgi:hypothetical protein